MGLITQSIVVCMEQVEEECILNNVAGGLSRGIVRRGKDLSRSPSVLNCVIVDGQRRLLDG